MKTYVVIHNKNSRGRNLKEEYINNLFESNNLQYIYEATNSFEELDQKIKLYNDSSKYQYCTIGGDGSLNALVNSLMINNISNPEVSVLPAGSGSDFIRTFAIPQKIEDAISHLCTKNYYEVDVGLVRNHNKEKYFVNVLNIGFLADSVETSEKFPNIVRKFRYPISFWLRIIFASASQTYISTDRGEFNGVAFNISVCNAQYFGGGWNISPKSSLQDGLFNAQIFAVTKLKAMKIFFLAKRGLHLKEPSVVLKKTSNIKLMTDQAIEIDGDYFGDGPAEIFIKKRAIRFKI
jgi:YegS/Rv2252/BmrU family lipid kinase